MLDHGHLPAGAKVDFFGPTLGQSPRNFHVWNKPRGKSMAFLFLLGCGGNGGNGFVGAVAAAGGGGGGGSGGAMSLIVPLSFLPDTLCVNTSIASDARIAIFNDTAGLTNSFLLWADAGTNGNNGTSGAGGGGGGGAAGHSYSDTNAAGLGKATFFGGQAGTAGGFNTTPPSAVVYPVTGLVCSGGAGGGGIQTAIATAGADVTGAGIIPTSTGGAAGTSGVAGGNGSNGLSFLSQLRAYTGGGGGGSGFPVATASAGGAGGIGGFGCGGGGGGAAVTGQAAGTGGRGGAGFAMIISW